MLGPLKPSKGFQASSHALSSSRGREQGERVMPTDLKPRASMPASDGRPNPLPAV